MDTTTDLPMTDAVAAEAALPQVRFAALLDQHRGIVLKIAHAYCYCPEDRRDLEALLEKVGLLKTASISR